MAVDGRDSLLPPHCWDCPPGMTSCVGVPAAGSAVRWPQIIITEWRGKLRREMNQTDQVKSARATDALLNYETVKYFTNERYGSLAAPGCSGGGSARGSGGWRGHECVTCCGASFPTVRLLACPPEAYRVRPQA